MKFLKHHKVLFLFFILFLTGRSLYSQCSTPITVYPFVETFELNNGGWTPGGIASDWAWGIPTKSVINRAGEGQKAWIIGGLTGNSYADAEASWLQTPCFDFSGLTFPYLQFLVFWEMEYQFDGASLHYSLDNGSSWTNLGTIHDPVDCLNDNWFNHDNITYLAPVSSNRSGWTGNIQSTAGSCRGGNGSNGWVTASKTLQSLAGEPAVIFRFVFGSGTICNNFNGFAIDHFRISEAPPNEALFTYTCENNKVIFTNQSILCPETFDWDFGDPASGSSNISNLEDPVHIFSGPGIYTVTLQVSAPGNAPSTITKQVTVLGLTTTILSQADCFTGSGGSAMVNASGGAEPYGYAWNTNPVQTTSTATNLGPFTYVVTVTAPNACPAKDTVVMPIDPTCTEVYFPNAFTPDQNGLNEGFGPSGNLVGISEYFFSVYNRWGEPVFHTNSPFEKWDGLFRSTRTDGNVFVWIAQYKWKGKLVRRKGTVLLIR